MPDVDDELVDVELDVEVLVEDVELDVDEDEVVDALEEEVLPEEVLAEDVELDVDEDEVVDVLEEVVLPEEPVLDDELDAPPVPPCEPIPLCPHATKSKPLTPSHAVNLDARMSTSAAPPAGAGGMLTASGLTGHAASASEARVLDAVRALGRATASEVADRTGHPNGSVVVALCGLVAPRPGRQHPDRALAEARRRRRGWISGRPPAKSGWASAQ